jgi:hypothetical protein
MLKFMFIQEGLAQCLVDNLKNVSFRTIPYLQLVQPVSRIRKLYYDSLDGSVGNLFDLPKLSFYLWGLVRQLERMLMSQVLFWMAVGQTAMRVPKWLLGKSVS